MFGMFHSQVEVSEYFQEIKQQNLLPAQIGDFNILTYYLERNKNERLI